MTEDLPRVLCVDDEPQVLEGLTRTLRRDFVVLTATSGAAGLQVLAERADIPVVVSDMRMPEMDGAEFLRRVRIRHPDATRILLTGQADISSAVSAINEGGIFRFLIKPTGREHLISALRDGVEQNRLLVAERELLQGTLRGAVDVLTEVLGMVNAVAFGRARRVAETVRHVANELQLEAVWRYEIAALLSQLGCVTLPVSLLERVQAGQPMTDEEQRAWTDHPAVAARLIGSIPRLGAIADMIGAQTEPAAAWDPADHVDVGRSLLALALDLDQHTVVGRSIGEAVARVRREGRHHDRLLAALDGLSVTVDDRVPASLGIDELVAGMVIDADVLAPDGVLLVSRGHQVTPTMVERLRAHRRTTGVVEPVRVLVPRARGWTPTAT